MFAGIGSYTFPWAVSAAGNCAHRRIGAKDLLRRASAAGIRYVQFGDNMPLHVLAHDQLVSIKQMAVSLNIHVQVGTRRLSSENITRYLQLAEIMHSPFLRVVIDDGSFKPVAEEVIEIIKTVLPLLQDKGIKLAIENHDRFPAKLLEQIILATDRHFVGICLDTANSIGAGESIRETVTVLAPYTVNLHLKDICIKRVDHKMGFMVEGTAAGDGMLDMPWIIEQLRRYKKCDTAVLECWISPEASMEATLLKEEQVTKKGIDYLKRILLL